MLNIELIQSDTENVRASLLRRGAEVPLDELIALDNKRKLIQKEVDSAMAGFSNYERVKEFTILPRLFTIEDGELTPTLKVVRKVVLEHYSDYVASIYSGAVKKVEEPDLVAG